MILFLGKYFSGNSFRQFLVMSLEKPAAETNNVETIELKEAANGYHQNGSQKLNVEDQNPNGHIANGNGPPKDHQQSNGAATKQLVKGKKNYHRYAQDL